MHCIHQTFRKNPGTLCDRKVGDCPEDSKRKMKGENGGQPGGAGPVIKLGAERDGFAAFMRIYAPSAHTWFPLVSPGITTLLSLAKDLFFCYWSRKNCIPISTRGLRERWRQSECRSASV